MTGVQTCALPISNIEKQLRPLSTDLRYLNEQVRLLEAVIDNFPGGIGQSAALFKLAPRLVDSAAQLVAACGCEAGCPSCVGPVGEVGERGKDTAQRLLTALRA